MQQTVPFREQEPVNPFGDRRNRFVAPPKRTEFAGDRPTRRTVTEPRPAREWMRRIARALARLRYRFEPTFVHGIHQLSKGSAKRIYFAEGGRISCRTGTVWITLDEGGEDIVLTACESANFDPGASFLVEALKESRVSLEAI